MSFYKEPKQLFIPKMISFIDSDSVLVQNEVDILLAKVAIEQLDSPSDEFISNISLVLLGSLQGLDHICLIVKLHYSF